VIGPRSRTGTAWCKGVGEGVGREDHSQVRGWADALSVDARTRARDVDQRDDDWPTGGAGSRDPRRGRTSATPRPSRGVCRSLPRPRRRPERESQLARGSFCLPPANREELPGLSDVIERIA